MVAGTHQELFNSSFTKIEFEDGLKLPPTQQPRDSKRVRFSKRNDDVFEIPHIDELSDEEIDAVWMKDEDFKAMRNECREIVMTVHKGCVDDLIGVEMRGLEKHMISYRSQQDAVSEILYASVEKLQCFQDETGADISDMLAEMCQKVSSLAVKTAHQTALQDEVAARGER